MLHKLISNKMLDLWCTIYQTNFAFISGAQCTIHNSDFCQCKMLCMRLHGASHTARLHYNLDAGSWATGKFCPKSSRVPRYAGKVFIGEGLGCKAEFIFIKKKFFCSFLEFCLRRDDADGSVWLKQYKKGEFFNVSKMI